MKALLFTDKGMSKISEVKKPDINESEILVKVKSCAICGTDIKLDKDSSTKLAKTGIKNMPFPRITGHEMTGVIEEKGGKVKLFEIGGKVNVAPVIPCMKCDYCKMGKMEVCDNKITFGFDIDGGFSEFLKVPEIAISAGCVNKIGDGLSFDEGTFTEPLAVVLNSQERSRVGKDDMVLIIGAGPIGILQIQIAKYNNAKKVIIAEISEDRLNIAKKFNPDVLINTKENDLVEAVLKETDGEGADAVMVCASVKALFENSIKVVKKLGRINFFTGLPKEDSKIIIDANLVHYNEIEITGTSDSTPLQNRTALDLLNSKKIRVDDLITHKFSIDNYYEGLHVAASGKAMKVVINL
ncbi:MAG: alcohol dehydrogenase catalytic domain-containing protein [Actinobacteria bacterium]|nr:alcohol dehydrogenase catalytic domain-containing protein [Actinomycetota bacterium]